jgi:hypothetical protein
MTKRAVAFAFAAALTIGAGCGSSSGRLVTQNAAAQLSAEVASIRQYAVDGNRVALEAQLDQLRADVAALQGKGELSATSAKQILVAATAVAGHLDQIATTTTTTTTTTTEPPATTNRKKDRGGNRGD